MYGSQPPLRAHPPVGITGVDERSPAHPAPDSATKISTAEINRPLLIVLDDVRIEIPPFLGDVVGELARLLSGDLAFDDLLGRRQQSLLVELARHEVREVGDVRREAPTLPHVRYDRILDHGNVEVLVGRDP